MYRLYAKANQLLSVDQWPQWIPLRDDLEELLDKVYVVEHTLTASETSIGVFLRVLFEGELAFSIPGLDAAELVIGVPEVPLPEAGYSGDDSGGETEDPDDLYIYEPSAPEGWTELAFALRITSTGFTLRVVDVSVELRASAALLHEPGSDEPAAIGLRGDLAFDGATESVTFEGYTAFALEQCEIGQSGILLTASDVKLDPSTAESPQEILDAGFDASFVGIYLGGASIELPLRRKNDDGSVSDENVTLTLSQATLGSGGVSGTLSVADLGITASLLGFDFVIADVAITLRQNALVEARLSGTLTLPFFKDEDGGPLTLRVDVSLGLDGDWSVAISGEQDAGHSVDDGIVTCPLGAFGSLSMDSITIASQDGVGVVTITGTLALAPQGRVELPEVTLSGLTIDTTGRITLEGGRLDLPQPERVDLLGLLTIEVVRVGFGQEGASIWISLDGGITLPEPLPISASLDGLRVAWVPGTPEVSVTLEGIGVSFTIPEVIAFSGFVGLDLEQFQVRGAIDVGILPVGLDIGAAFVIGEERNVRYFLFEIAAELPVGIPLGPFVGLFGMSGMFAYNLLANPEGQDWLTWFEENEASPDPLAGWEPRAGAFGLGAGVTLGSLPDNGFTIAVRSGLALLLPGPVISLQGIGNVLKARASLETEVPLFDAQALFDGPSKEILLSLSANYDIPHVLTMQGTAEAFFDLDDSSNWYIHVGEQPPERRLRADVLEGLFHGDAYLEIEPAGVAVGASVGLGDSWTFSPVTVTMEAWLEAEGEVSWSPQHYGASLELGGKFAIEAGPLEYGYAFEASAEGEAPHDEEINIRVRGEILLPWPLPDVEVETHLSWQSQTTPLPVTPIVNSIELFEYGATEGTALATTEASAPVVGMDACIAIAFGRAVADDVDAGNVIPNASSGIDRAGRYTLEYRLADLRLDKWNEESDTWEGPVALQGSWQNGGGTQIWLGPRSPFAGTQWLIEEGSGASSQTTYFDSLFADEWFPFGPPIDATPVCLDFSSHAEGDTLGPLWLEDDVLLASAPVIVRRVGAELGVPLSDTPLIVTFGAAGPVGAVSLRCVGLANISVRVTLDAGRSSPDPFVLGPSGGSLPADWRGVTALLITVPVTPVTTVLLEICWVDEVTLDQIDSRQDAIDLATESAPGWGGTWVTLTHGLYRLTCVAHTYRESVLLSTDSTTGFFRCDAPPDDLTPYIETTIPTPGQRPVFRKYDLAFFFRESYVEELYSGDLTSIVVDEDGIPAPPEPILSGLEPHSWSSNADGGDTGLVRWCEHTASLGIDSPSSDEIATPDVLRISMADVKLEPGRPYRARLTTGTNSLFEVPFVASKFEGFAELVASFNGTVWNDTIAWSSDAVRDDALASLAATAREAMSGETDATGTRFDDAYVEALGLTSRPWPRALEVRALRSNGLCYAIVVDLPEAVELARLGVVVTSPSGTPVALPSPDGSRILIVVLNGTVAVPAAAGSYGVALTFRRSVSVDDLPALPTLTRNGSSANEVATVTFSLE